MEEGFNLKKSGILKKISAALTTLKLTDKCLLVFMAILLFQTAHNLFFHEIIMQDSAAIDIVIRTTSAGIFGYFISVNFESGNKRTVTDTKPDVPPIIDLPPDLSSGTIGKIGFRTDTPAETQIEIQQKQPHSSQVYSNTKPNNTLQILSVAGIGVFSLIVMIVARNYMEINSSSGTTLSQLRDFVSGSVGFLIGHSGGENKTS